MQKAGDQAAGPIRLPALHCDQRQTDTRERRGQRCDLGACQQRAAAHDTRYFGREGSFAVHGIVVTAPDVTLHAKSEHCRPGVQVGRRSPEEGRERGVQDAKGA